MTGHFLSLRFSSFLFRLFSAFCLSSSLLSSSLLSSSICFSRILTFCLSSSSRCRSLVLDSAKSFCSCATMLRRYDSTLPPLSSTTGALVPGLPLYAGFQSGELLLWGRSWGCCSLLLGLKLPCFGDGLAYHATDASLAPQHHWLWRSLLVGIGTTSSLAQTWHTCSGWLAASSDIFW